MNTARCVFPVGTLYKPLSLFDCATLELPATFVGSKVLPPFSPCSLSFVSILAKAVKNPGMAEVIGVAASCLTIAGLFKLCIEAFDIIQTRQGQQHEHRYLTLALAVEKVRLHHWGQSMGLVDGCVATNDSPLNRFVHKSVVYRVLEFLKELLGGSEDLQQRYGCAPKEDEGNVVPSAVQHLSLAFDSFSMGLGKREHLSTFKTRARWIIKDGKKFKDFVHQVETMVSKLYDLTDIIIPVRVQTSSFVSKLESIRDVETLDLISQACQERHPDLAEAASIISDQRTIATEGTRAELVQDEAVNKFLENQLASMEEMTVTEMRHGWIEALDRNKVLEHKVRDIVGYWSCHKNHNAKGESSYQDCTILREVALARNVWLCHTYPQVGVPARIRPLLSLCCGDRNHRCLVQKPAYFAQPETIVRDFRKVAGDLEQLDRCINISILEPAPRGSHPQTDVYQPWFSWMSMLPFYTKQRFTTKDIWWLYYLPFPSKEDGFAWLQEVMRLIDLDTRIPGWANELNCLPREQTTTLVLLMISPPRKCEDPEASPQVLKPGEVSLGPGKAGVVAPEAKMNNTTAPETVRISSNPGKGARPLYLQRPQHPHKDFHAWNERHRSPPPFSHLQFLNESLKTRLEVASSEPVVTEGQNGSPHD